MSYPTKTMTARICEILASKSESGRGSYGKAKKTRKYFNNKSWWDPPPDLKYNHKPIYKETYKSALEADRKARSQSA